MINIRIEDRPAFRVVGRKTWIGGTDDSGQFGNFWAQCRADGTLDLLVQSGAQPGPNTSGMFLGVSCVERDPSNREFYFLVAVEKLNGSVSPDLEEYLVPASRWAVFSNRGQMPGALVDAEMHAFLEWLPASGCRHGAAPELEVYPPCAEGSDTLVEFWLPIEQAW